MIDPTKSVRKMYVQNLAGICSVYDTFAPADREPLYGVIVATSFSRDAIKGNDYVRFTVNLELYQEFKEYGNSEGVDLAAQQILDIMMPEDVGDYLTLDNFTLSETLFDDGGNDGGRNEAVVIFRKRLTLTHLLSRN